VSGGATAEVSFAVTCTAAIGSLMITTTTTGSLDLDGYTVTLDGGTAQTIGTNGTLTIPAVNSGAHRVTLGGLGTNCRAQGDNPRSVTVTGGATVTIAFSLDCMARIAFTRWGNLGSSSDIYVMNADGSHQTRIISGSGPAWSPDGTRIAFTSTRGNAEIYVMKADGSEVRRLTDHPAEDYSPTWSPDGTRIAFSRFADQSDSDDVIQFAEIMVMNADGSGVGQLTARSNEQFLYGAPAWSRDGSRIAFREWPDWEPSTGSILVMNSDGTDPRDIVPNDGDSWTGSPAWSTDGRIALDIARYTADATQNFDIYIMNADGSGQIRLTHHPAHDEAPRWSWDDRKIAFSSNRDVRGGDYRGQSTGIYVMNADGSGVTRLTNGEDYGPSWSP
jgi:Tol biopolymer transport system component